MTEITLKFTTEELHMLEFATAKYKELLPNKTSSEDYMLGDLYYRFHKAYIACEYQDFEKSIREKK